MYHLRLIVRFLLLMGVASTPAFAVICNWIINEVEGDGTAEVLAGWYGDLAQCLGDAETELASDATIVGARYDIAFSRCSVLRGTTQLVAHVGPPAWSCLFEEESSATSCSSDDDCQVVIANANADSITYRLGFCYTQALADSDWGSDYGGSEAMVGSCVCGRYAECASDGTEQCYWQQDNDWSFSYTGFIYAFKGSRLSALCAKTCEWQGDCYQEKSGETCVAIYEPVASVRFAHICACFFSPYYRHFQICHGANDTCDSYDNECDCGSLSWSCDSTYSIYTGTSSEYVYDANTCVYDSGTSSSSCVCGNTGDYCSGISEWCKDGINSGEDGLGSLATDAILGTCQCGGGPPCTGEDVDECDDGFCECGRESPCSYNTDSNICSGSCVCGLEGSECSGLSDTCDGSGTSAVCGCGAGGSPCSGQDINQCVSGNCQCGTTGASCAGTTDTCDGTGNSGTCKCGTGSPCMENEVCTSGSCYCGTNPPCEATSNRCDGTNCFCSGFSECTGDDVNTCDTIMGCICGMWSPCSVNTDSNICSGSDGSSAATCVCGSEGSACSGLSDTCEGSGTSAVCGCGSGGPPCSGQDINQCVSGVCQCGSTGASCSGTTDTCDGVGNSGTCKCGTGSPCKENEVCGGGVCYCNSNPTCEVTADICDGTNCLCGSNSECTGEDVNICDGTESECLCGVNQPCTGDSNKCDAVDGDTSAVCVCGDTGDACDGVTHLADTCDTSGSAPICKCGTDEPCADYNVDRCTSQVCMCGVNSGCNDTSSSLTPHCYEEDCFCGSGNVCEVSSNTCSNTTDTAVCMCASNPECTGITDTCDDSNGPGTCMCGTKPPCTDKNVNLCFDGSCKCGTDPPCRQFADTCSSANGGTCMCGSDPACDPDTEICKGGVCIPCVDVFPAFCAQFSKLGNCNKRNHYGLVLAYCQKTCRKCGTIDSCQGICEPKCNGVWREAQKQSIHVRCDNNNKPPRCTYSFRWEVLGTEVISRVASAKKLYELYKTTPLYSQSRGRIWTTTLTNKNKLVTWYNGQVLIRPGLKSIPAHKDEMDVVTVMLFKTAADRNQVRNVRHCFKFCGKGYVAKGYNCVLPTPAGHNPSKAKNGTSDGQLRET